MSTKYKNRVIAHLDKDVIRGMDEGTMTIKIHPGRVKRELIQFDDDMLERIRIVLGGKFDF